MFRIPETIDFDAKRLLSKILVVDPSKRPSAGEICCDRWVGAGKGGSVGAKSGKFLNLMQLGQSMM